MFQKINEQVDLQVNLHTKRIRNIMHEKDDMLYKYSTSLVGYLDDTTWFGTSLDQINKKLSIANEFYNIAKIQINVDKYKILTNDKQTLRNLISFNINNKIIQPQVTPINNCERILRLYINIRNKPQHTIKKGKAIVQSHYYMLKKKKLTHDHIRYIINKIIIPKLEYIFQHTILSYTQCQQIMAPLKKLFKHHIHLLLNASDNIIYNSLFPSINNLFDILVKSQLNTLSALFNTPVLREIAIQKIYNLQNELWLPNIPTDIIQFAQLSNNHSYLVKSLSLINQYRFNLDITFNSNTIGGTTPIHEYLPDLSLNDINSLKKKRIMFMDQLVSPDGNYLLIWLEVKTYHQNNYKGPKPKWFKNLEDNYTLSDMRRLTYPLKDPVCNVERYHKHPKIKAGVSQP
jgi:hypothetical protein